MARRKGRNPYLVATWVATWSEKGMPKSERFAVSIHGMEQAQYLATQKRLKMEKLIENGRI